MIEEINQTYDSYHNDHEEIDAIGDTELEGDFGLLLVTRRICLASQKLDEPWLRKKHISINMYGERKFFANSSLIQGVAIILFQTMRYGN